jgi:hypothetical protein
MAAFAEKYFAIKDQGTHASLPIVNSEDETK